MELLILANSSRIIAQPYGRYWIFNTLRTTRQNQSRFMMMMIIESLEPSTFTSITPSA
ncbi:hypothetical protein WG66_007567 [Moniliophthora roreri]|nr:hypothetical protein WG66_007567 [Moniliophthora roreri]